MRAIGNYNFGIVKSWMFVVNRIGNKRGEMAMGTILSIAIAIIIAAFVLIPQLRTFTNMVMRDVQNWWTNTVRDTILVSS